MPEPTVCISIVTFNSSRYIRRCLTAVMAQKGIRATIVVVDNASADGTAAILREFGSRIQVIWNPSNVGFAEAQNQGIRANRAEWVLTLNPDLLMEEDFVRRLVDAGELDAGAGAVCGKLLSIGKGFQPLAERRIDSTGLFFTPTVRHFDRGSRELDDGAYDRAEYVFGACAAAALYRRQMIDDISIDGDFFDPDFFAYREDADVAWRAQLMGWRCIYAPYARGYHVRKALPGNRRALPAFINMHSVKNRFLLRMKNMTWDLYRRNWFSITVRDMVVVGCCLLWEHTSLKAFPFLVKNWRRILDKRHKILSNQRVDDDYIASWFNFKPVSKPAPKKSAKPAAILSPRR